MHTICLASVSVVLVWRTRALAETQGGKAAREGEGVGAAAWFSATTAIAELGQQRARPRPLSSSGECADTCFDLPALLIGSTPVLQEIKDWACQANAVNFVELDPDRPGVV